MQSIIKLPTPHINKNCQILREKSRKQKKNKNISGPCVLFPETRAIARARAGTHSGNFTCAIYRTREVIVFSLLLLYLSRKDKFLIEKFFI